MADECAYGLVGVRSSKATDAERPRRASAVVLLPVLLPVLLVLACGDSDTVSGPGDPDPLEVTPAEVSLPALGQSSGVTVRFGDQVTTRPAVLIERESRWLHDVPVLDADSLAVGRLHATAPGTVHLVVSAFGQSAPLIVLVQPAGPLVMQIAGSKWLEPDSAITLRGYRLHEDIGEITLAGISAIILERDSASVKLRFPEPAPSAHCASADTIRVPGAQVLTSLVRYRTNGTRLELEVGEARVPTDQELSCLVLGAGTRYALAYYDPTSVEWARTRYEGGSDVSWLSASITPAALESVAPVIAAGNSGGVAKPRSDILRLARTSTGQNSYPSPHLRESPWAVGELFPVEPAPGWSIEARVHRIYDGRYVLAAEHDLGPDTVGIFVQILDSIMPAFVRESVPFYQSVFSERAAVTSTASDQFLILVGRSCFSGFAIEREDVNVARSVGWVVLGVCYLGGAPPYAEKDHLFNHEMAHIWSFIYAYDQLGERGLGGTIWGMEGVATLMAQEVLRRRLGIGLLSNYDARGQQHVYARSLRHQGMLFNGYNDSAYFLRDLLVRRILKGESYESALREVARWGVDGWYGFTACCDEYWSHIARVGPVPVGSRRGAAAPREARLPGLVARMQAVDPDWEPEHAVLLWTMAHAIDDRTSNPELQIHSFRDAVGTARSIDSIWYWQPDAEVTPGSGPVVFDREGGNSGYSYLHNDEGIGVYRIEPHEPGQRVRWLIARYQ